MIESLESYHLTTVQWTLALLSAVLVGVGKSGLNSISLIIVTTLAWVFGSKISTGILLPLLIVGDILALSYYKKTVDWRAIWRLLPWIVAGIVLGAWIGKDLNEVFFKRMMAIIVLIIVVMLFWFEKRPLKTVPTSIWFSSIMGIGTGFTSMVGNQAGGFANVYLLSMRLSKSHFMGTLAGLFLFVNCIKVPFHVFIWHTINAHSVVINVVLVPFLIVGFFIGINIVKRIAEERYRQVILWLTAAATVFVLFNA
jgi:uncharacterized protein